MKKIINVPYAFGGTTDDIELSYDVQLNDDMLEISCLVGKGHIPIWLQLHKFTVKSLRERGTYVPLFNDDSNQKNMDTALFIDKAYAAIMTREKLKLAQATTA